ncbi:MAG: hotdog fold domain-containing protein [Actinomycetota bacterium]
MTTSPQARPSAHAAVAGREAELGALTDALRRAIDLQVIVDAPAAVLAESAALVERAADLLAAFETSPRHFRFVIPTGDEIAPEDGWVMTDGMPYDVVVGRYNPIAPPVKIWIEGERAYGQCKFAHAYEGAPGWVHGAAIAAAFDLVLTAANHIAQVAGPTVWLKINYLKPTMLDEECEFEAWIEELGERRVKPRGRLLQGGVVKVEAEGEFVVIGGEARRERQAKLAAERGLSTS